MENGTEEARERTSSACFGFPVGGESGTQIYFTDKLLLSRDGARLSAAGRARHRRAAVGRRGGGGTPAYVGFTHHGRFWFYHGSGAAAAKGDYRDGGSDDEEEFHKGNRGVWDDREGDFQRAVLLCMTRAR